MSARTRVTWLGAKIRREDIAKLDAWLKKWNSLSGVRDNPSLTILYGNYNPRIPNNYFPEYKAPMEAKHVGWDVLADESGQGRCMLVMLFKSPSLESRHTELMKVLGASKQPDQEFKLYVSTLTWMRPGLLERQPLPILPFPLRLKREDIRIWEEIAPEKPSDQGHPIRDGLALGIGLSLGCILLAEFWR
jgi:hypothetical protein